MADVPETLETALADVPVAGRRCLEAGAGVGNATAGLREREAAFVYAVTNDREHAGDVRDRFAGSGDVAALLADLRSLPLPADAVGVVTAHALFNVVPPADAARIVAELTRVTEPGGWLLVDDYAPVPDDRVRALFAAENAVAALDADRPALTFYPREHLRGLFEAAGWRHEWTRTLLDPVPWTPELLDAHAELAVERSRRLPDPLGEGLREAVDRRRARAGDGVDTGEMYGLAFRLP